MEADAPKRRKRQTAQEAFRNLREKTKAEIIEKEQKLEVAKDKVLAAKANREKKKKDKAEEIDSVKSKESQMIKENPSTPSVEKKVEIQDLSDHQLPRIESTRSKLAIPASEHAVSSRQLISDSSQTHHRYHRRQGRCTNCCGGLPGQGPGAPRSRDTGQCCCNSANRLRGGSDDARWSRSDFKNLESRSSSVPAGKTEFPRSPMSAREFGCSKSVEFGERSSADSFPIRWVERSRGGCGGCGGSPQRSQRPQMDRRSCPPPSCCQPCQPCQPRQPCPSYQASPPVPACQRQQEPSLPSAKGCCPCGGCGGPASSDNPGDGGGGEVDGGCCGGSQPRGRPCKCKCQSCRSSRPPGGCGGQSCGGIYSCAGSGGGRCCFPRNYKRRSGADCCGGAGPNCGGCC